jgi:hypothetical protein
LFKPGDLNGITVVGRYGVLKFQLNGPKSVILDADGYLFIVEEYNDRIIREGSDGLHCIVGCSGQGSTPDQLRQPHAAAFDSYGNIFVIDTYNHRIQKFFLSTNVCGKCV